MNVFLIGYRGSGKTTVARELSLLTGWPWVDADELLEQRTGKSIKQIFAEGGEAAFRDLESQVVADLAARQGHIIALGGGAILREKNRVALTGKGLVVWLKAAPETLQARIAADPTSGLRRPNLTSQGGLGEIRTLLAERTPLYEACAGLVVDADQLDPATIARTIQAALRERNLA